MKTIQLIVAFLFLFSGMASAQTAAKKPVVKTSTFKVWGNCGMCKTTIEGAAKTSGATFANWDMDSKMLTVKYTPAKTNDDKIQKSIAGAGYDNVKYNAPDAAYDGLHECCKYDRKADAVNSKGEKGPKEACCVKDGKCTGNMECCKKMEGKSDCCKDGKCAEKGGCCADMKCDKEGSCCKKEGHAAVCCVKDGKCTGDKECCKKMEGKSDCCKDGKCAEKGGCCADMKCSKEGDCCKKDGMAKADCCKGAEGKCSHK